MLRLCLAKKKKQAANKIIHWSIQAFPEISATFSECFKLPPGVFCVLQEIKYFTFGQHFDLVGMSAPVLPEIKNDVPYDEKKDNHFQKHYSNRQLFNILTSVLSLTDDMVNGIKIWSTSGKKSDNR